MALNSVRALAQSLDDDGKTWRQWLYKTGGPASFGAGRWGDLSMGAGIPKYNAYVGTQFEATQRFGAANDGIYLGPTMANGEERYLSSMLLQSSSTTLAPAFFLLCDYLLFYPLVDGDDTAQQDLDNVAALPRYATGEGVRCMVVCTTPMVANAVLTVSYTNAAGVSGRTSTSRLLFSTAVGCIVSAADSSGAAGSAAPFIPLAAGDTGIRSIESVTLTTPCGGFFALVLVKPLTQVVLRESSMPVEVQFVPQHGCVVPKVYDGAYLNFIYLAGQNGTAVPLRGALDFAWR